MTNEEIIKGLQAVNEHIGRHFNEGGAWMAEFIDMAIKALRYRPIILQEHDAEPRRMKSLLDTATEEIYVRMLTKQGADILGITIEESDIDGDDD